MNVRSSGKTVGLGVLHVESDFPLVLGHLLNVETLGIPLTYECAGGVTPRQIVTCDPTIEEPIIAAARRLEKKGVGAIIGTCGSFINFQTALVQKIKIPVFSSILLVVPLLVRSLRLNGKVALIFASSASFSERARQEAAIDDTSRLVIAGCESLPAFRPIMENSPSFDSQALEQQLVSHIGDLLESDSTISMIVFQCSELAPYAAGVRERFGLAVFDINSLAQWVDGSLFGKR